MRNEHYPNFQRISIIKFEEMAKILDYKKWSAINFGTINIKNQPAPTAVIEN